MLSTEVQPGGVLVIDPTPPRPLMLGDTIDITIGPGGGGAMVVGASVNRELSCYANCDQSTTQPWLNVNDFTCFLNHFAAGDMYANCDNSSVAPVLNVNDFNCFLNRFAAGCDAP
jgi:hypothetical protein